MTAPSIQNIIALMTFDNTTHDMGYSSTGSIKGQATHVVSGGGEPAPFYNTYSLKLNANTGAGAFDSRAIIGHFNTGGGPATDKCFRMVFPFQYGNGAGVPSTATWIMRFRNTAITYSVTDFEIGLKQNTSGQIELHSTADLQNGTLSLKATGATVPTVDTWYVIELAIRRRQAGALNDYQLVVRLNGATEINYSILGSSYSVADRGWGGVVFGDAGASGNSVIHYIGPYSAEYSNPDVDMLKPTIRRVRPDGDTGGAFDDWYSTAGTPTAGTGTYTQWDENNPDTTDYNGTQVVTPTTAEQCSTCTTVPDGTYTPYGITVNGWVYYGGVGGTGTNAAMITDSTNLLITSVSLTVAGAYHTLSNIQQCVFMTQADGTTAWTTTAIAALQIGDQGSCSAAGKGNLNVIQLATVYAEVLINANEADYGPLPNPPSVAVTSYQYPTLIGTSAGII